MSRKIGLRTIQSIGGKVACPSAGIEQFTNDHFQTGDFTGWTQGIGNFAIDSGTCVASAWGTSIAPFLGSYDAAQLSINSVYLQNLLSKACPASCLKDSSTFSITTVDLGALCHPGTQIARILYTDGTFTDVTLNPAGVHTWVTYDLKPFVQTDKTISGVRFIGTTSYGDPTCILHVGQVSLKV